MPSPPLRARHKSTWLKIWRVRPRIRSNCPTAVSWYFFLSGPIARFRIATRPRFINSPKIFMAKPISGSSIPTPASRHRAFALISRNFTIPFPPSATSITLWSSASRLPSRPKARCSTPQEKLVYHGRIDNWYQDFGRSRPAAITHELEGAIRSA